MIKHLLIIEDDQVIAEVEKDYLEASGYSVEIAPSGDVGLQKALREEYDLIILDLMLPIVDGLYQQAV
jgi:DNA-binding response OmpR family regulator